MRLLPQSMCLALCVCTLLLVVPSSHSLPLSSVEGNEELRVADSVPDVGPSSTFAYDPGMYNLRWNTPAIASNDSMPTGNGDIGINVWTLANGTLFFYIGKTDSWSDDTRLFKLQLVALTLTPNPFNNTGGATYYQELQLDTGSVVVGGGLPHSPVTVQAYVDANQPVIRLRVTSAAPIQARVELRPWRNQLRVNVPLKDTGAGGYQPCFNVTVKPDTVSEYVAAYPNALQWYHRNGNGSVFDYAMKTQALEEMLPTYPNPLANRTFGGLVRAPDLTRVTPYILEGHVVNSSLISVYVLTAQLPSSADYEEKLAELVSNVDTTPEPQAYDKHVEWWGLFWQRSHTSIIRNATNPASATPFTISQNIALQRYMDAGTARGAYAIKFNGLIFNFEYQGHNPDYRAWGGGYWFQNTRFTYWRMLATGDFDMMEPLFKMYTNTIPIAKYRCQRYYQHDGGWFPEVMFFWGNYLLTDYGEYMPMCPHTGPPGHVRNSYVRYYKTQGLELTSIMLDHYFYTLDDAFAAKYLVPTAQMILDYFRYHFQRLDEGQGKMCIFPSAALETWQQVIDSGPDIYGLMWVSKQLQRMPQELLPAALQDTMKYIADYMPDIPVAQAGNNTYLTPGAAWYPKNSNSENVELYSVFPFRLFGRNRTAPDGLSYQVGNYSYQHRYVPCNYGWCQDVIDAAALGLVNDAVDMLVGRMLRTPAGRFPVFYFKGYNEYCPDEEQGVVGTIAANDMLLQVDEMRLLLLPTWPAAWDVDFKLNAPAQTVVEARFVDGQLALLRVTPPARAADVVYLGPGTFVPQSGKQLQGGSRMHIPLHLDPLAVVQHPKPKPRPDSKEGAKQGDAKPSVEASASNSAPAPALKPKQPEVTSESAASAAGRGTEPANV